MAEFAVGQRWVSESEPELGLGMVQSVDHRLVTVFFPGIEESRCYSLNETPLARIRFKKGASIEDVDGQQFQVIDLEERQGILFYHVSDAEGATTLLPETRLGSSISLQEPETRLFTAQFDSAKWFKLRFAALEHLDRLAKSPITGLAGARVGLIPHQLYIAHEVATRPNPRVLLADEVGLGKTIEAGLIIHQRLITEQASSVLIIVPDSLVHQWFVELLRRFNLHFSILEEDNHLDPEQALAAPWVLASASMALQYREALDKPWDLLVVDEAHHLDWQPGCPSPEYQLVESISQQSNGVILISATPEQLGQAGHFARLRLLDPARFYSLEAFIEEQQQFRELAGIVTRLENRESLTEHQKQWLAEHAPDFPLTTDNSTADETGQMIEALVDRHGTSRILFRNTRATIKGFPSRELHPAPLVFPDFYRAFKEAAASPYPEEFARLQKPETSEQWCQHDPRVAWLTQLLKTHRGTKFLLIAHHADTAIELELFLRYRHGIEAAVFHENLSLVERDRAAAWFADQTEGAQILLCSEIGSEGRNFQFAHHLVMFDLPHHPDLLEQRIGRLDRIGQTETIRIHVPYFEHTAQAVLFEWYLQGLQAFTKPQQAGDYFFQHYHEKLQSIFQQAPDVAADELDTLIRETQGKQAELEDEAAQGKDKLLAHSSFNEKRARALCDALHQQDQDTPFAFLEQAADCYGVDIEDHSENAYILRPGEGFHGEGFHNLDEEGLTFTTDRPLALAHDHWTFLTWEHPIVRDIMDTVLGQPKGRANFSALKTRALPPGTMLLEAIYRFSMQLPRRLQPMRFFEQGFDHRVISDQGQVIAIDHHKLNTQLTNVKPALARQFLQQREETLQKLVAISQQQANDLCRQQIEQASERATRWYQQEIDRLLALKQRNPNVRQEEIQLLENDRQMCLDGINKTSATAEAFRVIITHH